MTVKTTPLISLFTALLLLLSLPAMAQEGLFSYRLNAKTQTDGPKPSITLVCTASIADGSVRVKRRGAKDKRISLGRMNRGQEKLIPLDVPVGVHNVAIVIKAETSSGQSSTMEFEVEVARVRPIQLNVDPDRIDVGQGKLVLTSNRPLDRVDIEIFGNAKDPNFTTTQKLYGNRGDLELNWPPQSQDVTAIRLTAHDVDGFWNAVILEPFWVEIPHREVIFDTGKATWQDPETPKLSDTLTEIQSAMKKYARHGLQMRLYVAGYTDTVGSAADNDKLSRYRAKAIGKWFRSQGLSIPIFYQGFGERGLAVKTPDNTAEEKNRRALYILGNVPPPTSAQIPGSNWRPL